MGVIGRLACLAAVAGISACGGGRAADQRAEQEALRSQALAARSQATQLAPNAPCTRDDQCALLWFQNETALCETGYRPQDLHPYSRLAPSAAQAEAAAQRQNQLVLRVREIEQSIEMYPCPAIALLPPAPPVCVSSQCVQGPALPRPAGS